MFVYVQLVCLSSQEYDRPDQLSVEFSGPQMLLQTSGRWSSNVPNGRKPRRRAQALIERFGNSSVCLPGRDCLSTTQRCAERVSAWRLAHHFPVPAMCVPLMCQETKPQLSFSCSTPACQGWINAQTYEPPAWQNGFCKPWDWNAWVYSYAQACAGGLLHSTASMLC